jgi:hypothetical protein
MLSILRSLAYRMLLGLMVAFLPLAIAPAVRADSVNSPNITLGTDTNRSMGPGAGGVSVGVNTITLAETMLVEYAAGAGSKVVLRVRPGFELDPTSDVSASSTTFGINGTVAGTAAILTPSGSAEETLTWTLTSGGTGNQDLIRIDGIRLRIRDGAGAMGAAKATLELTTTGIGGAFTAQGLVAATITPGAADHLSFVTQPVDVPSGGKLLPAVAIVDAGEHVVTGDPRFIQLTIGENPGGTNLLGVTVANTIDGIVTSEASDGLRIPVGGNGYTLEATHDGAPFLSSDFVDSAPFNVAPSFATGLPSKIMSVKPAGTFKLVALGPIALPAQPSDNPILHGGTLTVAGSTWSVAFPLPVPGWKGLGASKDGSEGFRFKGVVCTSVILKTDSLKATCKIEVGTFPLPEPGPVTATLTVGTGSARYCAACGGTPSGKPEKIFTRKACAAPPACL